MKLFKKRNKGMFKKGNKMASREHRAPLGTGDQGVLEIVKLRALRGDPAMARLWLDHNRGGDDRPAVIHLYMPLAERLDRYPAGLEGAVVPIERDITLDASVPLSERQILGVGDGLTPAGVPTPELLADIAKLSEEQQEQCTARPVEQWRRYVDEALKP